ncbi:MAG: hypothetical protein ACREA4_10755 [Nitrososphaera sp.]
MMFSSSGEGKKPETDLVKERAEITQTGMKQMGTRSGANEGELEEGELYAYRKGKLEKLPRIEDGMRKVRITETAYEMAMEVGQDMREELKGYRPDAALIVSALIEHGNQGLEQKKDAVRRFVKELFGGKS